MGPGLGSLLSEARVLRECLAFVGDTLRRRGAARSGAKPVLLIPGFLAGDPTLYPIGNRLRRSGCEVFFSGISCNLDCPAKTIARLEHVLREAGRATGSRVVIIGHSLGGIYARELARRFPLLVERAILLGAPLQDPVGNSNQLLRTFAAIARPARLNCLVTLGKKCEACGLELPGQAPKVPLTIVYTKSDGVVNWRSCLESGANVETVEVRSSHCGLAVSSEVWNVITERLGQTPLPAPSSRGSDGDAYRIFRSRPPLARIPFRAGAAGRARFNRMEVASHLRCGACSSDLATNPGGDRTLVLKLGGHLSYYFCESCGDNVAGRIESDEARRRYVWYWAVPLKTVQTADGAA
jgi:pimeloyl-ACP methyl ester carboxylesterase